MWVQFTTGGDSFRAQGNSSRRNVSVQTFVRLQEKNKDGRLIVPLFAAYKDKERGFVKSDLIQTIPATSSFAENDAGIWFVNRHELLPGTEVLIEYRYRTSRGFSESVDHLLLVVDSNAPLYRLHIDLPIHHLSAVPVVYFEGRFELVKNDKQLSKAAVKAWQDFLGVELEDDKRDPIMLSDYMDPSQALEDQSWVYVELEKGSKPTVKIETENEDGKSRVKIRRVRKVKIR